VRILSVLSPVVEKIGKLVSKGQDQGVNIVLKFAGTTGIVYLKKAHR
jgi:hypothetical protein